jgi:hypothetical protein
MLENEFRNELNAAIPVACAVTKVGVEDKMQQVVFSGVDLLEHVLQTAKRYKKLFFFPIVFEFVLILTFVLLFFTI